MSDNLFTNKYPYTDFHEINLSWIIQQVEQLNVNLDTLEERVKEASIEASKEYVDSKLAGVYQEFAELTERVEGLQQYFDAKVDQLNSDYEQFERVVQAQVIILSNRIDAFRDELYTSIVGVNARTDLAIKQNNETLIATMERYLSNIKVINYFTGEKVTIQSMFDYLASLHADNGITFIALSEREKTYTQLAGLNITYTQLAFNGNILIV